MDQQSQKPAQPNLGSAFQLLTVSQKLVEKNWQAFVFVNLLTILFTIGSIFSPSDFTKTADNQPVYAPDWLKDPAIIGAVSAGVVIAIVVGLIFQAMVVALSVRVSRGETPTFSQLWSDGVSFAPRLFLMAIMAGLMILGGLILLIVPGVILIQRYTLAPYLMFDQNIGAKEALKRSRAMGKKYSGLVWAVVGVSIVVSIASGTLGIIPVIGGLLGTALAIWWSLVTPLRYFQLKDLEPESNTPAKANTPQPILGKTQKIKHQK